MGKKKLSKKAISTKDIVNTNKNKGLTLDNIENDLSDIFNSLVTDDPMDRQYKFFLYWLFGFPQKVCAEKAGYSESYASKLVQKYAKQPKLRHKVDEILNMFPERYRAFCKLKLPEVAEIEEQALGVYKRKPRLAIDKPQLLKQLKQGSGVDWGDSGEPAKPVTISLNEVRLSLWGKPEERKKLKMVEGKVLIDTDEDER